MDKPAIIAFAGTPWNSVWMNRQHLLSRLAARGHRIAYSNGVAHYSELRSLPLFPRLDWQDEVLVARRGYWLPASVRMSWLKRLSLGQHCKRLLGGLGGVHADDVIGMCFDPHMLDCIDVLAPGRRVFHIYDSYHRMYGRGFDLGSFRRRLADYDLVTASSAQMYEEVTGRAASPECIVANGVDFAAFSRQPHATSAIAARIAALPGRRIGYLGSINNKVDFALLQWLSERFVHDSFVLVGPTRHALLARRGSDLAAYERLCHQPNVHVFPPVQRQEIPAVLAAMHINCIFFRVDGDDWVSAVYPIKLNEYLASGKPVASSDLRVVREQFADVVHVCSTREAWATAIEGVGTDDEDRGHSARRLEVARGNDWERRVDQLETLLAALAQRGFALRPA